MRAKKTESGSYRVTVYDYKDSTGRIHQRTFTASTRREAERQAAAWQEGPRITDLTVGEAVKSYIDSKSPVLSPSTVRSYMSIYRTHFQSSRFGSIKLRALDNITVQRFISDLTVSPKSARNICGLLTASLQMYDPSLRFNITLPARIRPELHTPTTEEVRKLLQSIRGDRDLYICVLLCAYGPMRRSEACGIRYDDIDKNKNSITVRRARVQDKDKQWIYKETPKTDASYRTIIYPEEVITAIGRGFGYVIQSTPHALSCLFSKRLTEAGLPHFRIHDLRHFSASILHAIGIPDQYIIRRGGWATDNCMKRVYRNTLSDVEIQMNDKINNYFRKSIPG